MRTGGRPPQQLNYRVRILAAVKNTHYILIRKFQLYGPCKLRISGLMAPLRPVLSIRVMNCFRALATSRVQIYGLPYNALPLIGVELPR